MGVAAQRNVGTLIAAGAGGQLVSGAVATSTGSPYRGSTLDRLAVQRRYLSASILFAVQAIQGSATGAGAASYTLTPGVQDSADGTNWADYATDVPGVAQTRYAGGASASSASSTGTPAAGEQFVFKYDVDLSRARRYLRPSATVAVNSSSTGTATPSVTVNAAWVLGGADVYPA